MCVPLPLARYIALWQLPMIYVNVSELHISYCPPIVVPSHVAKHRLPPENNIATLLSEIDTIPLTLSLVAITVHCAFEMSYDIIPVEIGIRR